MAQALSSDREVQLIETDYPGDWVLVKVTESDDKERPIRGRVLLNHRSRQAISRELEQVIEASGPGGGPYYIFRSGNPTEAASAERRPEYRGPPASTDA